MVERWIQNEDPHTGNPSVRRESQDVRFEQHQHDEDHGADYEHDDKRPYG